MSSNKDINGLDSEAKHKDGKDIRSSDEEFEDGDDEASYNEQDEGEFNEEEQMFLQQ